MTEKTSIGVRISKDLYNQLRQYCIVAGKRPGALLDGFIKDGLAKLQPRQARVGERETASLPENTEKPEEKKPVRKGTKSGRFRGKP